MTASYAMEADIILSSPARSSASPGLASFSRPSAKKPPNGFQRAEFQVKHGFVDAIVPARSRRICSPKLLKVHAWKEVNETVTWEQQSYEAR